MLEKEKNKRIKLYLIAVIILLIFLHYVGILSSAEKQFINSFSFLQNKAYVFIMRVRYSFINYSEAQYLKKENVRLNVELNELIYKNSQLESYKLENEKLRSILNFQEEAGFDLIMANVIGIDTNKANTLILNKGLKDGLKEGYAVVVDNGVIIGKIFEVKDYISTILLLTDKQSQLTVSTVTNNKSIGLAEGEYGLSLKINLIPQDLELKESDIIITSGAEADIPRGLIVGEINRIISQENELFKSATLKLLSAYNEVTLVSVVLPKEL